MSYCSGVFRGLANGPEPFSKYPVKNMATQNATVINTE